MADHPHDGIEDYEAAPRRWLRGGNGCGSGNLHRNGARRRYQHHPHHYRSDCRSRSYSAVVRRSLGRRAANRLGMGGNNSRRWRYRRGYVRPGQLLAALSSVALRRLGVLQEQIHFFHVIARFAEWRDPVVPVDRPWPGVVTRDSKIQIPAVAIEKPPQIPGSAEDILTR